MIVSNSTSTKNTSLSVGILTKTINRENATIDETFFQEWLSPLRNKFVQAVEKKEYLKFKIGLIRSSIKC